MEEEASLDPHEVNGSTEAYRIFTSAFDLTCRASELPQESSSEDPLGWVKTRMRSMEYDNTLYALRKDIEREVGESVLRLRSMRSWDDLAVTLLVDHSGSLKRERRAQTALCAVETASRLFCALGVKHEILGFTTRTWRGGEARESWIKAGRPSAPGRLCELLHIVYREHDEPTTEPPDQLRHLLREDILKENVDGEAFLWALSRLRMRAEPHKALFHVSDGVPMDDSTANENGVEYLRRDFSAVIAAAAAEGDVSLFGVGIRESVEFFLARSVQVDQPEDVPAGLPPFLESALSGAASR